MNRELRKAQAHPAAQRRRRALANAGVIFGGLALAAAAWAGFDLGIRIAGGILIVSGAGHFVLNMLEAPSLPAPLDNAYYIQPLRHRLLHGLIGVRHRPSGPQIPIDDERPDHQDGN